MVPPIWRKILANVLGIELEIPVAEEGPGYGTAILAMVANGEYPDIENATDTLVKCREVVKPTPELTALYEERYSKYKKIYPALKSLYKEIK